MNGRVADSPFFANLFPASLKLGLDQADDLAVLGKQISHREQYLGQGDKGNVDGGKSRSFLNVLRHYVTDVCFLHADHSWVIAKLPV